MHYVYILRSKKDKNFYIGCTGNLKRRVAEHNAGYSFSTKHRVPFELVYYEAYISEKDAWIREKDLKLRANAFNQLKRRLSNSLGIRLSVGE